MKTRINSQLKSKKGLTLTETLIVVAIVVILGAIAFVGVQNLVDRNKQTKLDNIAQSMYVSAQNRIIELKASGEIDKLFTYAELRDVEDKPADWEEDPDDTVNHDSLRYFYHNKDTSLSNLVDFIFPKGSIDDDVLDDNWVIELDPITGYVYSAFYSEERSADSFYVNNTESLDKSGTSSIRFKEFRDDLKGDNKVGYYGGKANMPEDANGDKINASLNIINADILQANMTAILPSGPDIDTLTFELTVKGKTSKQSVTIKQDFDVMPAGPSKFTLSVVLDELEVGKRFQDTFGDATWPSPSQLTSLTYDEVSRTPVDAALTPGDAALTPGEDLELSFSVSSDNNSVLDVGPIVRTVNSLFESLNTISETETETEANIAYGRHLQNLDNSTSGLPATAVTSAKQISDIDFDDDSDNTRPVEEQFLWKTLYGDKTFTPIDNSDLMKYSGYIDPSAPESSDSFKIINMQIGDNANPVNTAGLFGSFAGNEISGLTMVDEKIYGGSEAGGLVGKATSNLTISDVTMDNTKIDGGTDVGGLVGTADSDLTISGVTMDNTKIDSGTDVGGLVGTATSTFNLTISNVTMDKTQINSGTNVGGLVGTATSTSNLKISNVNMDNTKIDGDTDVGGLVGTATSTSNLKISNVNMDNTQIDSGTNVGGLMGVGTATSDLTISDVTMDNTQINGSTDVGGLVGNVTSDLTISKVTMDNTKIENGTDVGGLVGTATSDLTISKVTMDNTQIDSGTDVGGLVGVGTAGSNLKMSEVTMKNTKIENGTNVGGLIGKATSDLMISNATMVNTEIDGGTNVGGLVGVGTATSDLTIKDCQLYVEKDYFKPDTYEDNILLKGTTNVGGLVGSSSSNLTIEHSFASTIIEGTGSIGGLIGTSGNADIKDSYADSYLIGGAPTSKIGGLAGELAAGSSISGSYSAGFAIGSVEDEIAAAAGFVPNGIASVTNSYSLFNSSESKATAIYSTVPSATTVTNVYYFKSEATDLEGSEEYKFTSIAEAATKLGGKFSNDDNTLDTHPYNQKTDLEPDPLITYPYLSITDLPHYGDWKIPPEPEEVPDFGKTGLFYWENVEGGSQGYKIYIVGRKGEPNNFKAVYHDTTNVAHNDGGIVKEYGYGYFVKEGVKNLKVKVTWNGVSVHERTATNNAADFYFDNKYNGYKFHCYTTCDEANPATSYNTDGINANKYLFMTQNAQNATVVLNPTTTSKLEYTFCPFFAKSIKIKDWGKWAWTYAGTKPDLHQYDPGTVGNPYRIRSLDQLQFINWNSLSKTNDRMTNDDRDSSTYRRPYYCKYFPYLMSAKYPSSINVDYFNNIWSYPLLSPLDGLSDFTALRERQNFIQDYDIECIGRTGYTPIAALGETSGTAEITYRVPFFAWFGGSFEGQSYKIKNLSITSGCYSVGVFGLTVSATIRNVVLIRDSKDTVPVIKRPAGSPQGYYAIGTLVGMANEYSTGTYKRGVSPYDYVGIIENCAVAGYEVIDESDQPVSCGETTIGGLAGVLRTKINRCSAVTTIKINTNRHRGTGVCGINYEDNITVGGIAGTNQTRIFNCYSGGRVIVDPSLIYTDPDAANGVYKLNIYISGIASSAFTCKPINMHAYNDESSAFISPKYYNCYSYMVLPQPSGNLKVAVIGGDACYNENDFLPKQLGGELNNCYYYANNYKTDQMIISDEPGWIDNGIYSKSYDDMFLEQFCTDLNDSSSPAPYHKITSSNYSFPCGDASLEDKIFPFPAVVTQEYSGEYVHYGEWPIELPVDGDLQLTKPTMNLDLFSYHEDTITGEFIGDYFDETEVKFYDGEVQKNISLSNLQIKKGDEWIDFVDGNPVIIDGKISVAASVDESVDETDKNICKLTVMGIDKTEETEITLGYLVKGEYFSATLKVSVTAEVNLSANPITPTTVPTEETVRWNLILKDKKGNLIDCDEITTTRDNWDYNSLTNIPAGQSTPASEPVVFNLSIEKAVARPEEDISPFYLVATAQNAGEANFEVQALNIKVRDPSNTRTFDSNKLSLHAICSTENTENTGKLILKHYAGDGTDKYIANSYIYNNGEQGIIDPSLVSTDTNKSYSALKDDMIGKVSALTPTPVFAGWYIKDKDEIGNYQKLLNPDGTICEEAANIADFTEDGKFNVNPDPMTAVNPDSEGNIVLYAMWNIPYNLKFVSGYNNASLPVTDNTKKYLVIAKVTEGGIDPEYYCMTGDPPGQNQPVTWTLVNVQHLQGDYYNLNSPSVSTDKMLWDVVDLYNTKFFKLFKNDNFTYIRWNEGANAVFCGVTNGLEQTKYNSEKHDLYFTDWMSPDVNWRILFNNTEKKFYFENFNPNDPNTLDGGIWLFEYSLDPDPQEILHEFK